MNFIKNHTKSLFLFGMFIVGAALIGLCLMAPHQLGLISSAYSAGTDQAQKKAEEDDFDRLDGTGKSGKRVDVIEWAGNLEIHVYPKGSLVGLALKLDKKNKNKPVMVIGYRFNNFPNTPMIRRNILGIPMSEGFNVYKDPTTDDYDKIIISNNMITEGVIAFKTDPEPKQMYPDGHPALADKGESDSSRSPASKTEEDDTPKADIDENGTIKPFKFK